MLTAKYMYALAALKAQSEGHFNDVKHSAQDCEAEAGHIYRIMCAHNTNISEMNEELLERFMAEEIASGSPYPNPDRDGLQYVCFDQNVEVYPVHNFTAINGLSYTLRAHEARAMLSQLAVMGKLSLITDTIQSLCQRNDGTMLQTSFPSLIDVKDCIQSGLNVPAELLAKIKQWESLGATEINFDFVQLKAIY
jgi:hypothetical protein